MITVSSHGGTSPAATVEAAASSDSRSKLPYLLLFLATFGIAVLLVLPGSHLPKVESVQVSHRVGLIAHVGLWFLWSLVLSYAVPTLRDPVWPRICLVIPAALVSGLMVEWLQNIAPNERSFTIDDLAANMVGALLAVLLIIVWDRWRAWHHT